MKILIIGANGQLGSEIQDLSTNYVKNDFIFKDLPELDICNFKLLNDYISYNKIDVVINCAAYTDVDKAEEEVEISKKVNTLGVKHLVASIENIQGELVHLSTDYVFNGNNYLPDKEDDKVDPIGVYANSKRGGELAVIKRDLDAIVIRTSRLYSSYVNNFVKKMINLGKERETLRVVFDQVGPPTYARDLAKTCLDIIYNKEKERLSDRGQIYHYSNEGVTSWYDFANEIMTIGDIICDVPIETRDYPTLSKRPHYSGLNKSKIKEDFNLDIPYWKDSVKKCIKKINA